MSDLKIIPERPFDDGVDEGHKLGKEAVLSQTEALLRDKFLKPTLGSMSRKSLAAYVVSRLEAPPDFGRYPELLDIYPERLDRLRGVARGAGCTLAEAAMHSYATFRQHIDSWYWMHQVEPEPGHCSGIMFHGPDGVIGGQSAESGPPSRPKAYRWRNPKPYAGLRQREKPPEPLELRRPRTGYIERWGVGNEKGVTCFASVSCSVWLDEPIEDTWPIGPVPLMRFARDVRHFAELYQRYTLHNWTRANQLYADLTGDAVAVEKCFRRIGFRWIGKDRTLCVTEGHFETPEMHNYIRAKRHEYVARMGRDLGAGDMQYATDCYVRFTRLQELCHQDHGRHTRGYEHIRRVLTDHAPFPRAVCRHGGPDTAPYDQSITLASGFDDLTHNRSFTRHWVPWKKFCCQVPEVVTQYPARP